MSHHGTREWAKLQAGCARPRCFISSRVMRVRCESCKPLTHTPQLARKRQSIANYAVEARAWPDMQCQKAAWARGVESKMQSGYIAKLQAWIIHTTGGDAFSRLQILLRLKPQACHQGLRSCALHSQTSTCHQGIRSI